MGSCGSERTRRISYTACYYDYTQLGLIACWNTCYHEAEVELASLHATIRAACHHFGDCEMCHHVG